jgi:hypothetical protein
MFGHDAHVNARDTSEESLCQEETNERKVDPGRRRQTPAPGRRIIMVEAMRSFVIGA